MTGCTARRYDQFETSPEAIEQELRPAVCERRQTDRLKANYSIDSRLCYSESDISSVTHVLGYNIVTFGSVLHTLL